MTFDSSDHVLPIDAELIDRILIPAANYFDATARYPLEQLPMFEGVGVYAIYVRPDADTIYRDVLHEEYPIYVGKAVPSGSRQGRSTTSNRQLRSRLMEHRRSIEQGGMPASAFYCRFMIMQGLGEDLIPAMESTLIRRYHPIWNSYIDGFGIHTPGAGRFNQQPSEWDTLHPGRPWLDKLTGAPRDKALILKKIKSYRMREG
ncbi:hypothetical protein QWA_06565 [Alcaligenes faecalis subsp. faecalis NCIB 8687]|nr:hypothetical protein QWA_06565 [Alcaligenes faecalis subsp. faecalis NCIB 8687]